MGCLSCNSVSVSWTPVVFKLMSSGYNIQLMVRQIFICMEFKLQYSCIRYWVASCAVWFMYTDKQGDLYGCDKRQEVD